MWWKHRCDPLWAPKSLTSSPIPMIVTLGMSIMHSGRRKKAHVNGCIHGLYIFVPSSLYWDPILLWKKTSGQECTNVIISHGLKWESSNSPKLMCVQRSAAASGDRRGSQYTATKNDTFHGLLTCQEMMKGEDLPRGVTRLYRAPPPNTSILK